MANGPTPPSEPGWYRDPDGRYSHEAYWDGEKWTGAFRPNQSEVERARNARRRSTRRVFLTLSAVVLIPALVFGVAACATDLFCVYDFTYLPALKADPMASPEIPGTALIDSYDDREGMVLGKPTHAEVHRIYEIDDGYRIDQVFRGTIALAESYGWDMEPYEPGASSSRGTKALRTGRASIRITAPGIGQGGSDPSRRLILTITNLERP